MRRTTPGEEAIIFKAQNLHGRCWRKCGRGKCGGQCALPREICNGVNEATTCIARCEEGIAEVSRGHSRAKIDPSEGLNIVKPMETPDG